MSKTYLKRLIQAAVIALVAAGVWRAADKARRDLRVQGERIEAELGSIDAQLQRANAPQLAKLRAQRDAVAAQRLTPGNIHYGRLLAAGAVYLLGLLPAWLYWHRILSVMRQRPTWYESLRAYYIGHLGKYVPGKALVVILRATLVRSERTAVAPAALAVFVETLTTMAVGAFVAAACLTLTSQSRSLIALSVALLVGAGVPTIPPLFRRLVRLARVKQADDLLQQQVERIDGRLLAAGWALGAANWCLMGLCLYLVLSALPTPTLRLTQLPLLTGAVSLAAVAGFLSLLPGGLGVRELVVTELLTPTYGAVLGVTSAIVLRVLWLVCELAFSAILYAFAPASAPVSSPLSSPVSSPPQH